MLIIDFGGSNKRIPIPVTGCAVACEKLTTTTTTTPATSTFFFALNVKAGNSPQEDVFGPDSRKKRDPDSDLLDWEHENPYKQIYGDPYEPVLENPTIYENLEAERIQNSSFSVNITTTTSTTSIPTSSATTESLSSFLP